jgi:hypothetical protein
MNLYSGDRSVTVHAMSKHRVPSYRLLPKFKPPLEALLKNEKPDSVPKELVEAGLVEGKESEEVIAKDRRVLATNLVNHDDFLGKRRLLQDQTKDPQPKSYLGSAEEAAAAAEADQAIIDELLEAGLLEVHEEDREILDSPYDPPMN